MSARSRFRRARSPLGADRRRMARRRGALVRRPRPAPPAARGGSLAHRAEARGSDRQRGAAACYRRTVLAEPSAPRSPRAHAKRLAAGRGRYADDLRFPRLLHAAFLRSPHGHARISKLSLRKHERNGRRRRRLTPRPSPRSASRGRRSSPPGRDTARRRSRRSRPGGRCGRASRSRSCLRARAPSPRTRWSASRPSGSRSTRVADPKRRWRRARRWCIRSSAATSLSSTPRGRRRAAGRAGWCSASRGSRAIPACRSSRARSSPTSTRRCASSRSTSRRRCRTRCARCTPIASASPSRTFA